MPTLLLNSYQFRTGTLKIDKKMLGVKLGIKPNMKKKSMLRTYPVEHK